jgi:hypothetical protein
VDAPTLEVSVKRALYFVYATGQAGSSALMLYIGDGIVAGADAGTGRYEGTAAEKPGGGLSAVINFTIAAGQPMITGGTAPANMPPIPVTLDLPPGFDDGRTIALKTPLGPLNVRIEKIRDLP